MTDLADKRVVVVFDLGGVLTVPVFDAIEQYGSQLELPPGTLSRFFRGDHDFGAVERGEMSFRDFLKSVGTRVQSGYGVRLDVRMLAAAAEAGGQLAPEMIELVGQLHGAGARLGLMTNNVKEARVWREQLPRELFDVVLDSSAVGLRKPDAAIYQLLLAELDAAASDVIYVDDFEENLPPAAALGMRVVHFAGVADLRRQLAGFGVDVALGRAS